MIFITGPHAVGKTFLAQRLELDGFSSIDLGPTLKSVWLSQSPDMSFEEFIGRGESEQGVHFTDKLLARAVSQKLLDLSESGGTHDLLIIGSRSASGINYLKDNTVRYNGRDAVIIYIDAPETILHGRYCLREGMDIPFDQFKLILERDREMGLEGIKSIANELVINDGSPEHYVLEIDGLIFGKLGYERQNSRGERGN